jgi:hypothetical protein
MPKNFQAQHDFLALKILDPRKLMNLFLVNFGSSTTMEVCHQIHSVFIYINLYICWKVFCPVFFTTFAHFQATMVCRWDFLKTCSIVHLFIDSIFCVIDLLTKMTRICMKIITHKKIVRRNFNCFFIDIIAIHITFYDIIVHNSSCLVYM